MDTQNVNGQGSGNGIVFLVGAVFNILAGLDFSLLIEHTIQAVVGGLAFILLQSLWNWVRPVLLKLKNAVLKFFAAHGDEE